jgi:hypothetical protein
MLLLLCLNAAAGTNLPFSFTLLPDGPPYPLLDLPLLSTSPPFTRSVNIADIPPSEKLHVNSGNLFMKVPDNSSSWAYATVEFQVHRLSLSLAPSSNLRRFASACSWCRIRRVLLGDTPRTPPPCVHLFDSMP